MEAKWSLQILLFLLKVKVKVKFIHQSAHHVKTMPPGIFFSIENIFKNPPTKLVGFSVGNSP
jgi:hypothetical protein